MNIDIPYYFFELLKKDRSSFIYQGEFDDDLTERSIRLGEYSARRNMDFNRIRKKVSFLIAECLQNIIRYEEKPRIVHQTNNRPGIFMVRNMKNSYYISSSNLIKNEKVDGLKSKLKRINELGKEDLKNMQQTILADQTYTEKGGAGLGLVEITRKSGHKLEYDFEHVNFYLSCFYLQIKLAAGRETGEIPNVSLVGSRGVFNDILHKKVMLLYKGDCSQQSMLPVLSMIEAHLKKGNGQFNARKKVFYLLVEILQNMSKHAIDMDGMRQGILVISKKDQKYYIYSGNYIAAEKEEELKNYLKKINEMDKEQLTSLYKQHLLDEQVRPKGGAGLGLIDMARYSTDKLLYDFRKYDSKSAFYSFGLCV